VQKKLKLQLNVYERKLELNVVQFIIRLLVIYQKQRKQNNY
jgi:hypothetical protein